MPTEETAVQEEAAMAARVSITMDEELRDIVDAMARKADRSFSAEVRQALREWAEKAEGRTA